MADSGWPPRHSLSSRHLPIPEWVEALGLQTGRITTPLTPLGTKVHIGTSKQGLVHSLVSGPANEADITKLDGLLHGAEEELYGDQAYWSEEHRQHCKHAGIRYRVNRRPPSKNYPLTEYQRRINRARSRCRARGEHAFHVVKRRWGFATVRYRGVAKNTARMFAIFALANLYLVWRRLLSREVQFAL